jgi:hypothetical protein
MKAQRSQNLPDQNSPPLFHSLLPLGLAACVSVVASGSPDCQTRPGPPPGQGPQTVDYPDFWPADCERKMLPPDLQRTNTNFSLFPWKEKEKEHTFVCTTKD